MAEATSAILMTDSVDRYQRVRSLFDEVSALPREAHAAAVRERCAGDAPLQEEVERLLDASARAGSFLESGATLPEMAGPEATASERTGPEAPDVIGRRLGPYEVQASIGAGGMGRVYRAHDTMLRRDVALKILPEPFASDPDRLSRFHREAQVLASLNHPHIGAIYGIEAVDDVHALVLELIEGPTLADRIDRGAIPLDETLAIARQIVDALEAAHDRGIVHRDLKPSNIKLRPDGTVKVLDFGLAKALDRSGLDRSGAHDEPSPLPSPSPAAVMPASTRVGMLIGTAAYMSPEQATGRAADPRSDIWAFGCVLFEMLTGRQAFEGEDVPQTMSAVLTKEPDWRLLPRTTPASIHRLLRRCLERDRKRRLAAIADARLELDDRSLESEITAGALTSSKNGGARLRRWWPWIVTAASVAIALWLASRGLVDRPTADRAVYRSTILLPGRLGAISGNRGSTVALSPDGRRLAFVATETNGRSRLWLRSLDGLQSQPLADTDGAGSPFWSPDGRWIAFVADEVLKKIEATGGPVFTLCDRAWAGGTWSRDDVIVFTESANHTLARVRAAGGPSSPVTRANFTAGEWGHLSPVFLGDGRHLVYAPVTASMQSLGLHVVSIEGDTPARLPVPATFVQYARGFLWFLREGALVAQPFDERRRAVTGEPVPVADRLRAILNATAFSVSANALVFQAESSPGLELTWFDRGGRVLSTLGTPDDYADLTLSPDGRQAAVSVAAPGASNRDLWIVDATRGVRTRFTTDPAPEMHNAWSPDGASIAFDARVPGRFAMFRKPSNGVGDAETLLVDGFDNNPMSWSPDGRSLLYVTRRAGTSNLWVLPIDGSRQPFALTQSAFNTAGQISPDGRWVAYASTDSGRMEVYLAPFPGPGARLLVSTGGGLDPRWRRDGRELLYMDGSRLLSAAIAIEGDRIEVGAVKPLFDLPKIGPRYTYDVSPDGQRILAVTRKGEADAALTLVVNWPALVTR